MRSCRPHSRGHGRSLNDSLRGLGISTNSQRGITRNALGIAVASGAYAVSFGALSTIAGLSLLQTCALSVLMFTGASQFALVGAVAAGGSASAGPLPPALPASPTPLYA